MSKGGHGAAAASVLMLKKSEDKRQELALREAFKVRKQGWIGRRGQENTSEIAKWHLEPFEQNYSQEYLGDTLRINLKASSSYFD